jgi:hypothetical protein
MDNVQPGKITGRRGHVQEGHLRVAPGTGGISVGGGRGWAIWRALQAVQVGFEEMVTPKHGKNRSICRYHCRQSGKGLCVLQAKVHHDRRCVDTFPGQCCNGHLALGGNWHRFVERGGLRVRACSESVEAKKPLWKHVAVWPSHGRPRVTI